MKSITILCPFPGPIDTVIPPFPWLLTLVLFLLSELDSVFHTLSVDEFADIQNLYPISDIRTSKGDLRADQTHSQYITIWNPGRIGL